MKAWRIPSIAKQAVWHRCLVDASCKVCGSTIVARTAEDRWSWDAFNLCACVCLQERPDRFQSSMAEFHRVGLCSVVQYYRPVRPTAEEVHKRGFQRVSAYGSWESHRAVAIKALASNAFDKSKGKLGCIFVCEDDVQFVRAFGPKRLRKMLRQIESLDGDFDLFYFGWVSVPIPGKSWPASRSDWSLWRTEAVTLHAYVLSEKGARLLAGNPYHAYESKLWPWFLDFRREKREKREHFLDDFTRQRFVAYCSLPSVAVQSDSHSDQNVRGKELGLALHNRIVSSAPCLLETITMVVPFLCLLVILLLLLRFVAELALWMDRLG